MEIIIKISDEDYERLKLYKKAPFSSLTSRIYEAVANGIPLEECEDCVSLDAVIDVFDTWWAHNHESDNAIELLEDKLNALSPVKPAEKVGRWILVQRGKYVDVNCSECGFSRIKEFAYNYTVEDISEQEFRDFVENNKMNFCECCGAKMDVPDNNVGEMGGDAE